MYSYNYPVRRMNGMSFRRSFGYALGHMAAHAAVNKGAQTMQKMIENRHRIIDVESVSVGDRWKQKHKRFSGDDFSRSVNKPRRETVIVYKTPFWKIVFWMLVSGLGVAYFGTNWFTTPSDIGDVKIVGYYKTKDGSGDVLCILRSDPPSVWDSVPVICPKGHKPPRG